MIWDKPLHAAFPDLLERAGTFYCCFREGDNHAGGQEGTVRLLKSSDAVQWKPAAHLSLSGVDLRDPPLSITPDGRFMLIMGGSIYEKGVFKTCFPRLTFSKDGKRWDPITSLTTLPYEWIWAVEWFDGIAYGLSYRTDQTPWLLTLFSSRDGVHFSPLHKFRLRKNPSEGRLRFQKDGTMIALLRERGSGKIGVAAPPYKKWKWHSLKGHLGGSNFVMEDDACMWAAARRLREGQKKNKKEIEAYVSLAKMTKTSFKEVCEVPSGGDCGYPGLVIQEKPSTWPTILLVVENGNLD